MILGLLMWFSLSLGLQDSVVGDNTSYYQLPPISLDIEIHAENEWLDIYGKYYNGMYPSPPRFSPTQDIYVVGAKITYNSVSLTLETGCYHPVSNSPLEPLSGFWGGFNRFFITFDSKK